MTALWLARRSDGSFVTASIGSCSPAGRSRTSNATTARPGETKEELWDRKLKDARYHDPVARKGMIDQLKKMRDPKKQEETLRRWLNEGDEDKRNATMDKYRKKATASAGGGDRASGYDKRLKDAGYNDPKARKKLTESLMGMEPDTAEKKLKEWETDRQKKKERMARVTGKEGRDAAGQPPAGAVPSRRGRTPDTVDPEDFTGDLMDLRAPPGLGPPANSNTVLRQPDSDDESVTAGDLSPIRPGGAGGPARRPSNGTTTTNEGSGASDNGTDGFSETESTNTAKSGGLRNWFRRRREEKKAKKKGTKEVKRLTENRQRAREPAMRGDPPKGAFGQALLAPPIGSHYSRPTDPSWSSGIPDYQTQPETALWEKVLEQDSIELIMHYLKRGRVYPEVAGWILMDMMTELNPVKVQAMVKDISSALNDDEWEKILAPYRNRYRTKSGWTPQNSFWYEGDIDHSGAKIEGNLDHLLWSLRRNGIQSAARNAMVRDLMSTPRNDRPAYEQKYNEIFARGTGQLRGGLDSAAAQAQERRALIREYQEKQQFGNQWVMSEAEAHDVSEGLKRKGYGLDYRSQALRDARAMPERPL